MKERSQIQLTPNAEESLRSNKVLLESILSRANLQAAYQAVKRNKGSAGVDGMTLATWKPYLIENWEGIKRELLSGSYNPEGVKEVAIAKANGSQRHLGIPTVLDRLIQQAILQKLQPEIDKSFSAYSYGFRPNRSAHQAVRQMKRYVGSGYRVVVDLDLENFFDTISHDRLMSKLKERIGDQRVLNLIRKYLNAGRYVKGVKQKRTSGVPQGSPLSPLLSNLILDELDVELSRRGHNFVRYADDCNILVKSQRSGERTLRNISCFLENRLKLKVNKEKSAVDKVEKRTFLGFRCISESERTKLTISESSIKRFKEKVRTYTRIRGGKSFNQILWDINPLIRGWREYFSAADPGYALKRLDSWIRRRIRACVYSLKKTGKKRLSYLNSG